MRILQIVHDFLPRHVAGVEVYTDELSRQLAREHEVALLFSEVVPEVPNYTLRRGRYGDVATYEVVNNHAFKRFEETYWNSAVDGRVREVLDEFRPDVVHIQHLLNLSLGILEDLRRRRVPVVMTLHEHWLACANGGQRYHRDLGRCDVLDASRCGACTAHMNGVRLRAGGFLRRLRVLDRAAEERSGVLALTTLEPTRAEAPAASYIYRDRYLLHAVARETWVAHPPARLLFDIDAREGASFSTHVAMHASTFSAPGGGVRFSVWTDGELASEIVLDPKRRAEDRYPRRLEIPLRAGRIAIELRTASVPEDQLEFATAGWIDPRVERAVPAGPGLLHHVVRSAARVAGPLRRSPSRRQAARIERRWETVRRLARSVDQFLLPSRYLMNEMVRFGLPAERMVHCDYGFPVESFRRREDLPDVVREFAFLGSLVRHKGMHVLLEAFAGLPEDARLRVGGSPSYDPDYTALLQAQIRHPGVSFVGGVPPDRVPQFLLGVDTLIVPSIWNENSPLTIHEAFLAGVPVVASRMGGSSELLEEGGGLLYPPDDPLALRIQLRRLYDEPGLARRLAASAPAVKTINDHVEELIHIYESVRAERKRESVES